MPKADYRCASCGFTAEVSWEMRKCPVPYMTCPECMSTMKRVWTPVGRSYNCLKPTGSETSSS